MAAFAITSEMFSWRPSARRLRQWTLPGPVAVRSHVDGERLHVVGPRVERVSLLEFEARVVPVAGQHAVLDGPPRQREPHVRTAVVDGVHLAVVVEEGDGLAVLADDGPAPLAQVLEVGHGNVVGST
jgi:hypothetical protein